MTTKLKIRAHLLSQQANIDPLLYFYCLYLQISLADVYSVSSLQQWLNFRYVYEEFTKEGFCFCCFGEI